ncbi:Hypothetical protein DHA2_93002 [Giardia duodenalis]|uniref:Uncharacterized protein n=1 Tax=Giardia intestinalis TaxID=5741 RepID=V6TAR1_GIAIN|nr:Hypothetical protein DHA2_93002 [Giardia intestinalis]
MDGDLVYYSECCALFKSIRELDPEDIEAHVPSLQRLPQTLLEHIDLGLSPQISDEVKEQGREAGLSDEAISVAAKFSLRAHAYRALISLCHALQGSPSNTHLATCLTEIWQSNLPTRLVDSVTSLVTGQGTVLTPAVLAQPSPVQLLTAQLVAEDLRHASIVLYCLSTAKRPSAQFVAMCCRLAQTSEAVLEQLHKCFYALPVVLQRVMSNVTMATHILSVTYVSAYVNCAELLGPDQAVQGARNLYACDLIPIMSTAATSSAARTAFFWLYCVFSTFKPSYSQESLAEIVQLTFTELCQQELDPALRAQKETMKLGSLSRNQLFAEQEKQTAFGRVATSIAQPVHRQPGAKEYPSVIEFEEKLSLVRTYLSRHLMDDNVISSLLDYTSVKPILHIAEFPAPSFGVFINFARICYHVKHMDDPGNNNPMTGINASNEAEYRDYLLDQISLTEFTDVVLRLAMAGVSLYLETDRTLRFVPPITVSLGKVTDGLCTLVHDDFLAILPSLYNTLGALFGTTFSWMDPIVKQCRFEEARTYYELVGFLMDKCLDYERSEIDALQSSHGQRKSIANVGISRYDRHNFATAAGSLEPMLGGGAHSAGHLGMTLGAIELPNMHMYCSRLMACVGCMLAVGGDHAFRGLNSDNIVALILGWIFSELDTPGQILGAISITQGLAHCPAYGVNCMKTLLRNTADTTLTKPLADLVNSQKAAHIGAYGQETVGYGGFDISTVSTKLNSKVYNAVTSYAAPFSIYLINKLIITIGGVDLFIKDEFSPAPRSNTKHAPVEMVRETAFGIQHISVSGVHVNYEGRGGLAPDLVRPDDVTAILTARDVISFENESDYVPQTLKTTRNQLLKTLTTNLTPLTNTSDFDLLILEQSVRTLALYDINPEIVSQIAFSVLLRLAVTLTITIDPATRHPKYNSILEAQTNLRYLRLLEAALSLLASANSTESIIFLRGLASTPLTPDIATICSSLTEITFQTGPLYEAGGFSSVELATPLHALEDMITSIIYSSFIGGKSALIDLLQSYLSSSLCIHAKVRVEYMHRSVCTVAREISLIVLSDLSSSDRNYNESTNLLAVLRILNKHSSLLHLFDSILKLFNICLRSSLTSTDEDLLIGISEVLILDHFSILAESMMDILLSDHEFLSTTAMFVSNSAIAALHSQHIYTLVNTQPLIQTPPESSEQSVISSLLFIARLLVLARHPTFLIPNVTNAINLLINSRATCPYDGDLPGRYAAQDTTGKYATANRVTVYREQVSVRMGTSSFILLLFCLLDHFCTSSLHNAAKVLLLELRKSMGSDALAREIEGSCSFREMLIRARHSFLHSPTCAEALLVAVSCELPSETSLLSSRILWTPSPRLLKLFFLGEESRRVVEHRSMLRLDRTTSLYHALQTLLKRNDDSLWLYPGVAEHGYNLLSQFLEYTFVGPQAPQSQDAMHVLTDLGGEFFTDLFIKTGLIARRTRRLQDAALNNGAMGDPVRDETDLQLMNKTTAVLFATASCLRLMTIYLHIIFNSSNLVRDITVSELISGLFGLVIGTLCYPQCNEDSLDRLLETLPPADREKMRPPRTPAKFDSFSHDAVQVITMAAAEAFSANTGTDYLNLYEIIIECMQILSDTPKPELSDVSQHAILPAVSNLTGQGLRYAPLVSQTKLRTQLILSPLTQDQREKVMRDSVLINNNACLMEGFTAFLRALNNLQSGAYRTICDSIRAGLLSNCGKVIPLSALMNTYLVSSIVPLNCYVYVKDRILTNIVPEILDEMLFAIQQAAVLIKQQICSADSGDIFFLSASCFNWLKLSVRVLANIVPDHNECSLQHAFSATASVMQTICHIANVASERGAFMISFLEKLSSELNVQSYFSDAFRIAMSTVGTCSSKVLSPEIKEYTGHAALTMIQSTIELIDILLAFSSVTEEVSTLFTEFLHRLVNQGTMTDLFETVLGIGRTLFSSVAPLKTTSLVTQSVAMSRRIDTAKSRFKASAVAPLGTATVDKLGSLADVPELVGAFQQTNAPDHISTGMAAGILPYDITPAGTLFVRGLLLLVARLANWCRDPLLIESYVGRLVEEGSGWNELLKLLSFNTLRERMADGTDSIDQTFRSFFVDGTNSLEEVYELAAGKSAVGEIITTSQYNALMSSFLFRIHSVGYAFLSMLATIVSVTPDRHQKSGLTQKNTKSLVPSHFYTAIVPNIISNIHILMSLKASVQPGIKFCRESPLPLILTLVLGEVDKCLAIVFADGVHSNEIVRSLCNFLCVTSDILGQTVPPIQSSMQQGISYYPLPTAAFIPPISSAVSCLLEYIIYSLSGVTGATVGMGGAVTSQLLAVTRDIGSSVIPLFDGILFALTSFSSNDTLDENNCLQCIERIEYILLVLLQPEYQLIIDKAYSGDVVSRPNVGYVDMSNKLEHIMLTVTESDSQATGNLVKIIRSILKCHV